MPKSQNTKQKLKENKPKNKQKNKKKGGSEKINNVNTYQSKIKEQFKKEENKNLMYCSPSHQKYEKEGTCFSKKSLIKIATAYNKNHNDKIKKIKSSSKKNLHNKIHEKLSKVCNNEQCWMTLPFINQTDDYEMKKNTFRPRKPDEWYEDKYTWLDTYNILDIMAQYQFKYDNFMFLGAYPIDFASSDYLGKCIIQEMCDINLKKLLNKNINSFGVIFNLDKHNEPGSHWVGSYCSFNPKNKNYGIYFYDSYASGPPPEVKLFMKQIKQQVMIINKTRRTFEIKSNGKRNQYGGSECGMFCLHFLIELVKGSSIDTFFNTRVRDQDVNELRNILYTPRKLLKKKHY